MADVLNFLPLRVETVDDIRARIDADVNAGLDPDDEAWIDTTEGSFYYDITQALILELERLWDFAATDVVAASLVEYAWGDYLDDHGATVGVPRKEAVAATGEVTFTGTDDVLIPIGTEVATVQTDPDEEPIAYVTTDSGVIAGGSVTLPVQAVEEGTAGNVPAAAVELLLSPVENISEVTNAEAITGGADPETDEAYRERLRLANTAAQGGGSIADYERWALGWPGVGNVRVVPLWNGPGTVRVIVTDEDNNPVSAAIKEGLQDYLDPYSAETELDGGVTLPNATITVLDTTGFAASGRIYVGSQLVEYTGKTATTFTGCTGGSGSIPDGTAVIQHGEGRGQAPVGHIVTVDTPATLTVDISATVTPRDGYSIDGAGGTIALDAEIEAVLRDYVDNLPPGGEDPPGSESPVGSGFVLLQRVEGRIVQVAGVYNISDVEINGVADDLAVGALQVPALGTVTLS